MAKKKEVRRTFVEMHPALAMAAAFKVVKNIEPINLVRSSRVADTLSSGSLAMDLILGGGFARGRMATYFGPEASGKSTLIQEAIASAQRNKVPITHYDIETSADPLYMAKQGVNLNWKIWVEKKSHPGYFPTQPIAGEDAYRHILATLRRMPDVDTGPPTALFVIDSYAGMASEKIVDDEEDKETFALEPRMHSMYLKRIRARLRIKGGLLLGTNQVRTVIGGYMSGMEEETGGKALKYYPDYRIMVTRKHKIEEDATKLRRILVNWRTSKNRLFPPMKIMMEMAIILGRGIDKAQDALHFLTHIGAIEGSRGKKGEGGLKKILLPSFPDKFLSWKKFRTLTERNDVRKHLFDMMKDQETFDRYDEYSKDINLVYDVKEKEEKAPRRKKKTRKKKATSKKRATPKKRTAKKKVAPKKKKTTTKKR